MELVVGLPYAIEAHLLEGKKASIRAPLLRLVGETAEKFGHLKTLGQRDGIISKRTRTVCTISPSMFDRRSRHYFPCADDIKYNEALSLVRRLIETCGDSVRNLLNERKRIAFVSEADIAAVCNQFSPSDAQRLVRKFYR